MTRHQKYDIHNWKVNCYHLSGEYFGDIVQSIKMVITSDPEEKIYNSIRMTQYNLTY